MPEIELFDVHGNRLYLTQEERRAFLKAVKHEDRLGRTLKT